MHTINHSDHHLGPNEKNRERQILETIKYQITVNSFFT